MRRKGCLNWRLGSDDPIKGDIMKFKFIPENKEEEDLLKSHSEVRPILEVYLPIVQGRALMAGVHLKIFETIAHKALSLEQLVDTLSLNPESLGLLLNVLVCSNYLVYKKEKYSLTELSKKTLLPDAECQVWGGIEYARIRWKMLDHLEEVIKTGKGVDIHKDFLNTHENWTFYQRSMYEHAVVGADEIANNIPVREGAKKMLDIGGAHGLYGAKICQMHPPMTSTVFDLPDAVKTAESLAKEAGIDNIVDFKPGNALKDDLGSDYDLIFASNLCHHFTEQENQKFLCKIYAALKEGGSVALFGFTPPDLENNQNLSNALMSLMFKVNSGGRNYAPSDYTNWAESAGFKQVDIQPKFAKKNKILMVGIK